MIRIINNKKIDLTDSEYKLYKQISSSYDRPNFNGTDLFEGLFETDSKGKIVFLIPPKQKISMEVYLFIVNVMIHQHLGEACTDVQNMISEGNIVINEWKKLLHDAKKEAKK